MAKKMGSPASAAGATWRLAVGAEFSRVRPGRRARLEFITWQNIKHNSHDSQPTEEKYRWHCKKRKNTCEANKKRVEKKDKSIIIAIIRDQSGIL